MRKIVFLLLLVFVVSCSKEDDNIIHKTKEIRINLTNNLSYSYFLGRFIEEQEDIAEITEQASHFEISELTVSEASGNISYKYKPQLGYVGEDYVEILSERTTDIENNKKEITTVKLTFIILEE